MQFKTLCTRLLVGAALCLLLGTVAPHLMAQSAGTSALTGTITDPSGAAIPNVTVTITSNDTGQSRTTTTGSDGGYKFSLLPPGNYKISFAAAGFKTSEVASVAVERHRDAATEPDARSWTADRTSHCGSGGRDAADPEFHARNDGDLAASDWTAAEQPQLHAASQHGGWCERRCEQRHRARQSHAGHQRERRRSQPEQLPNGRRLHRQHGQHRFVERLGHLHRHRHSQSGRDSGIQDPDLDL